jgi:hypothetical protein
VIIKAQRFPWYMGVTAGVGAVGLVTGVGTLASAFEPMFGSIWAWGAAVLLDTLALALTVWAIQATRANLPAAAPRTAAHLCIAASVVMQAVTAYQGLAGGASGWTSALAHTIPPLVLCLALELITRHFLAEYRAQRAPVAAAETLRVQVARAATGLPVDMSKCAKAVVEAARADTVDIQVLARTLDPSEIAAHPALRALAAVTDSGLSTREPAQLSSAREPAERSWAQLTECSVPAHEPLRRAAAAQPAQPNRLTAQVREQVSERAESIRAALSREPGASGSRLAELTGIPASSVNKIRKEMSL